MLPSRELLQSRGETIESIREAFNAHLVVPDVIDRAPSMKLTLKYKNSVFVEIGSLQVAENVFDIPEIDLSQFEPSKFYTLIMTDVPNRAMPTDREFLHWLVVNINENDVEKGLEIVPYCPPLPQLGTGLHRYVFMILEQSTPISFSSSPTPPKDSLNDDRYDQIPLRSKSPIPPKNDTKNSRNDKEDRDRDREKKTSKSDEPTKNRSINHKDNDQLSPYDDMKFRLSPTPQLSPRTDRRYNIPNIERKKFSTKEFVKKHTIRSIAAGNFFQTEFDEFVRKVSSPPKSDDESKVEKKSSKDDKKTPTFIPKKIIDVTDEVKALRISKI